MMKKRIMAVIATSVLCMSISFGVFAGSTGRSGTTAGGSMGVLNTSATLSVDFDKAIAKTSSGSGAEVTYATSVIFYYMNEIANPPAMLGRIE